jgi:hypothetical protein
LATVSSQAGSGRSHILFERLKLADWCPFRRWLSITDFAAAESAKVRMLRGVALPGAAII